MKTIVKAFDIFISATPEHASVQSIESLFHLQFSADYDSFIENLEILLEENNFKIDRSYPSNRSGSLSHYIVCHRISDEFATKIKCVFDVHVSDYRLSRAAQKAQKAYWRGDKGKLADKLGKSIERWKVKNIYLDGKLYSSYDEILDEIQAQIATWIS